MSEPVNVADYAALAAEKVDPKVWCYFEGGAGDEVSLRANAAAYGRWRFRPRMLVDVAGSSAATTVLGTPVSMPLLVAPFAMQRLLDPEGEVATARATAAAGTLLCVSTITSSTHAEIAAAAPATRRAGCSSTSSATGSATLDHLAEARECGYSALVLTVDMPRLGRRERDLRLGFQIPAELPLPYMRSTAHSHDETMAQHFSTTPSLTWDDLEWIAAESGLPLVLKGILTREDAALAVEHGVAGVVRLQPRRPPARRRRRRARRAARGGRGGRRPLRGLRRRRRQPRRRRAEGARARRPGGLRRPGGGGGLAVGGEAGVRDVLSILHDEIELGLALLGCTSPEQVTRAHVEPVVPYDSSPT